jgi:hypothetical protein
VRRTMSFLVMGWVDSVGLFDGRDFLRDSDLNKLLAVFLSAEEACGDISSATGCDAIEVRRGLGSERFRSIMPFAMSMSLS